VRLNHVDSSIANIVGLCSGVGLLEEAVRLGLEHLGIRSRLALCCEWDAYAAACLLARMEESSVEPIEGGDFREKTGPPRLPQQPIDQMAT
jgi:site-specific DNA-cytosine methylase